MKTILLIFAHPDDESFSCGLVIPKYVKAGWNVQLLCATRGEEGESGPYEGITGDSLGGIRRSEVEDAAKVLGISGISFMGYHDSTLSERTPGELEDVIFRKMIEYIPDIVITMEPTYGISNHPDHMRLGISTTYAFQKYCKEIFDTRKFVEDVNNRDPNVKKRNFLIKHKFALRQESFEEAVERNTDPKLYYSCIPQSVVTHLQKTKVMPDMSFGKPWIGVDDKKVTTVIEGKAYMKTKMKALACHKTQSADVDRFYSSDSNPLAFQEFFMLRMHGLTEVFMGKHDKVSDRL